MLCNQANTALDKAIMIVVVFTFIAK